jgi:hypothetical protein
MKMENEKMLELLEMIASKVSGIETEMKGVLPDISGLKKDVKDIQLTLENETNKNIQLIAEGHFDLSRKLDEALKVENEKEMLLIRVNRLENELRKLKERIETIA